MNREIVKKLRESSSVEDRTKVYKITCMDDEGTLLKILEYIRDNGNGGHSFSIVIDPGDEREQKFYWDGDGPDRIYEIEVE